MKVTINAETKKSIYAYQIPAARAIVDSMKEDEGTPAGYALYAANLLTDSEALSVLSASAYVMPNSRVYNNFGDDSENLDVWVDFIAETWDGFIKGGAYLSDIWQIGPDETREELKRHMYCRRAKYDN